MTNTNELSALQYKYEWNDHLQMLYEDFIRRNNKEEWIFFLRRPELAQPEISEEIAVFVLRYITQIGNISLEIVKLVENVFHYIDNRKKYEKMVGYEYMELYETCLVTEKEFPPYELFGEYDNGKNYDDYLNKFNDIYFGLESGIDPEELKPMLKDLQSLDIEHPYYALIESELYVMNGAWAEAADCLKSLEDGYYKNKQMGHVLFEMEQFEMAEECYSAAMEQNAGLHDVNVMGDYIACKWYTGKYLEAFETANRFIDMGYEFNILPVKKQLLSQLTELLMEKGKAYELTESEMLIIKEYYKQYEDYETVIRMGELGWKKGYKDGSWTVDTIEAYFEMGRYEPAQSIIDMVNDGRKMLSAADRFKVREVKARLLFAQDKIAEAYEIMETLCTMPESTMKQKFILAGMYRTTGNYSDAIKILRYLRFYSKYNLSYSYELGRCLMLEGEPEHAYDLFLYVFNEDPEFKRAGFYMVETAADMAKKEKAVEHLKKASKYMTDYERRYLEGEIEELNRNFEAAKNIYEDLINEYTAGLYPEKFLYDIYVRFFLVQEAMDVRIKPLIEAIKNTLRRLQEADELWVYFAEFLERIDADPKEYERCYSYALKANKFNKAAIVNLARIYSCQEKWDLAIDMCNKLITYAGENEAYYYRANFELEMGAYDQCIKDLTHYEKNGGDVNNCHITRQELAKRQGDYEEAIKHIEARLENRKVSEVPCYDDMAICLCKLGRWQEAAELMDIVCETSKYPGFHGILYHIRKYNGDFKGAREALKRLKKLCGVSLLNDDYNLLQVKLMLDSGMGMATQTVAEGIASTEGERLCAVLELLYGSSTKAIRLFNKLIKKEPEEVENYIWCALALQMKGKKESAEKIADYGLNVFEKAYGKIEISTRPNRFYQYGMLKMLSGKAAEAREIFQKALKLPTCPESACTGCYKAHCGLGILYALNGHNSAAASEFDESLRIRPYNTICKKIRSKLLKK